MLPLALFDITDVTARAAVYEGYDDNVIELRPSPTVEGERRGAPFTGVDVSATRSDLGARSEQSLSLGARGQHYTPLDGRDVGGDDGAFSLGWRGGFTAGPVTKLTLSQSFLLADQNTARLADLPLSYLEPSIGRQTFLFSLTDASYLRELAPRDRVRVTLGNEARDMLSDTSPVTPGPGIDYLAPRVENAWTHDLGPNDAGTAIVTLRWSDTPRSLLDASGRVGPTESWQVAPALMWTHALSESWRSELTGGASFATTRSDVYDAAFVTPTVAEQLIFTKGQQFASIAGSFGFSTTSPAFGPGVTESLGVQWGGPLGRIGVGRDVVVALTANASRSAIPVSSTSSFVLTAAGGGAAVRYALSRWLGLLGGYDARWLALSQTNSSAPGTEFHRSLVFVGLSGSFSSAPGELPLDVPRPPLQ
jgi:hypothetical protein